MKWSLLIILLAGSAAGAETPSTNVANVFLRGWSGSLSGSAGLSRVGVGGESAKEAPRSDTFSATLRYNPVSFWYGRVTVTRYLQPDRRQPWNPDFTYGFGYDDWHPGTVSLTYENYGANCIWCKGGAPVTRFQDGSVSAGYKVPIRRGPFSVSVGAHVNPRYFDLASNDRRALKTTVTADLRWAIRGRWYVSGRAVAYPMKQQKQPWDPDFTYGFGYFDWRPGTLSVEYANYAPNRFAWSRSQPGKKGTFRDGSVSMSWTWSAGGKRK